MGDLVESRVSLRRPIAFLFPPQPLEPCPMPRDFLPRFPALAHAYGKALAAVDWPARLRRLAEGWPLRPRSGDGLRCAHVGTVAFSWALTELLGECGITPDVVFGHSLGLHSALVAAGATVITDTLDVVDRTARFLAQKPSALPGSMLAVSGFAPEEIRDRIERVKPRKAMFVAIINSRLQVVVSGRKGPVQRLARRLRAGGAWGLSRLPSPLPLHTPLMSQLAGRCAALVEGTHCHIPRVRLLHPSTGQPVQTVSGVKGLWRTHLINSIDFTAGLRAMQEMEVATYLEVGVGETLSKLGRWYRRDLPVFAAGRPENLEKIVNARVE